MLYCEPTTIVNITGRNLAHARRSAVERALLGADLHLDRLRLERPTIKQVAAILRVCQPYIAAAIQVAGDPDARAAVLAGRVPLAIAGWSLTRESLAEHYARASRDEKSALGQAAGVGNVWDEVIVPNTL